MMKNSVLLIFLMFFLGCNFELTKNNEVNERDKANEVVDIFYKNIKDKTLGELENIYCDEFKANVNIENFNRALLSYSQVLGDYVDRELYKWATERSEVDNISKVSIIYVVNYTRNKSIEKFNLIKKGDSFRILNYTINSKALENHN